MSYVTEARSKRDGRDGSSVHNPHWEASDEKMNDHEQWCISADGSIPISEHLSGLDYHPKLNVLLVTSRESGLMVFDTTSSSLIKKTSLTATNKENIRCYYIPEREQLLFSDGATITARQDSNGMFILDSALSTKLESENDNVQLELSLTEAETLLKGIDTAQIMKVEMMDEILTDIRNAVRKAQMANRNQKQTKWSTVMLERPQYLLLNIFQHIMTQLKQRSDMSRGTDPNCALPIAAALTERVGYYAKDFSIDTPVPLDKTLMYSEAARLASFSRWPHKDYKWALPENMAQAGFYHQPTDSNDDRCMCFTCTVCLVCWEKTDEPWSEHERHQPSCPFIRGHTTQNVPLSVYYATQPAVPHDHSMVCFSKCGTSSYVASLHLCQNRISIWKVGKQMDLSKTLIISPQRRESPMHIQGGGDIGTVPLNVTAMCLLGEENENSMLQLVTGGLHGQNLELSVYETGCVRPKRPADPNIMEIAGFGDTPDTQVGSTGGYTVSEPPPVSTPEGVVVPIQAELLERLHVPNEVNRPGFVVSIIEQTLDGKGLLVYVKFTYDEGLPGSDISGALLLYKVRVRNGTPYVEPHPMLTRLYSTQADSIVHINQLGLEFSSTRETEGDDQEIYHMMVTTHSGAIKLMMVSQLKELTSVAGNYVQSVYCAGVDRVCATTSCGDVRMLQVNPICPSLSMADGDMSGAYPPSPALKDVYNFLDRPMTPEHMERLQSLTACENLSGKFTATFPAAWTEVQQEQQQRKHPQHLQQTEGTNSQASLIRTWKLQSDSGSSDAEQMIEIALPKISSIGHVDIAFRLKSNVSEIPNVKVALLFYKMDAQKGTAPSGTPRHLANDWDRNFLSPLFMDKHNLELLRGPVSLASCADLSGQSGHVTLTSPALLRVRPRSLVIYMKNVNEYNYNKQTEPMSEIQKSLFPKMRGKVEAGQRGGGAPRGIHALEEVSICVRKTKTTKISQERLCRLALLEYQPVHRALLEVAASGRLLGEDGLLRTEQQNRCDAMKLLSWIASLQSNDVNIRQYEKSLLKTLSSRLPDLVRSSFIKGSRTASHTAARLIAGCTELSRTLNGYRTVETFAGAVLEALLKHMSSLTDIESAGALHLYFLLLNRVSSLKPDQVADRSIDLLSRLANQYNDSFSDSDLALLVKYGYNRCPYDSETFDGRLPPFVIRNAPGATYAAAVAGQKPGSDYEPTFQTVDLMDSNCQTVTLEEQLTARTAGLLEVEPLQFSINSYSEYINVTHGNNPNITPVFYGTGSTNAPDPATLTAGFPINVPLMSGTNQQQFAAYIAEVKKMKDVFQQSEATGNALPIGSLAKLKELEKKFVQAMTKNVPTIGAMWPPSFLGAKIPKPTKTSGSTVTNVPDVITVSAPYPSIQAILQPPTEFTLIVGRMSNGSARRFIVLDFGQPIRLTDVVIPACNDLSSISIDVWCEGEGLDSQRLVVCPDIGNRTLALSDIQPACVCRYLKITYAARSSSTSQTYRIPLGCFYGHAYVFPWETTANVVALRTADDVRGQMSVYASAAEDIKCCYKIACGKLKQLMQMVDSQDCDVYNPESCSSGNSDLDTQVQQTYEECMRLQQQLNLAYNAVKRLKSVLPEHRSGFAMTEKSICRDKVRSAIESTLQTLLALTNKTVPKALCYLLAADKAKELTMNLCFKGNRNIQVLTGNLLLKVCSEQKWFGRLFSHILAERFTSSCTTCFPKYRVFSLLMSMAQRSVSNTREVSRRVCGPVLELLAGLLSPINDTAVTTSTGFVDVELVSWLLLFLSRLLDSNFVRPDGQQTGPLLNRWDFLVGDIGMSRTRSTAYQQQKPRERAKSARNAYQKRKETPRPSGRSSKTSKMHHPLRHPRDLMREKDMMRMKMKRLGAENFADPMRKRRVMMMMMDPELSMMGDDMDMLVAGASLADTELLLDRRVILPVVRGLMKLLLHANFSCHADLFVLACKVLSRLATSTRPTLKLSEVATQEQISKLLYNLTHVHFNTGKHVWGGPWVKHAVTCLIQDLIEGERAHLEPESEQPESAEPSTSSSAQRPPPAPYRMSRKYNRYMPDMGSSMSEMMDPMGPYGHMHPMELMRMKEDMMMYDEMMDMDMMYGAMEPDFSISEQLMMLMGGGPPGLAKMMGDDGPPPDRSFSVQAFSCAIDSRLENQSDSLTDVRLQVWLSDDLGSLHQSVSKITKPTLPAITSAGFRVDATHPVATADDISFAQNGNTEPTTEQLLGACFSSLITAEGPHLDAESLFTLYLEITEEFREEVKGPFDPTCPPHIELTTEAIEGLVNNIELAGSLNNKAWTQVLRILTILLNSNLDDDERVFALRLCGSNAFQELLYKFLRSCDMVGVATVKAFQDLLTRIQYVYVAANQDLRILADMLLASVVRIVSESSPTGRQIYGALDAQCALVDFVAKLPSLHSASRSLTPLFEATVGIARQLIDRQELIQSYVEGESDSLTLPSESGSTSDPRSPHNCTASHLAVRLINLLCRIIKASPSGSQDMSQDTDSRKLSRNAGDLNTEESMDISDTEETATDLPQTDEQKRSETPVERRVVDRRPSRCLHLMDVDVTPTIADRMISHRPLVAALIHCLSQSTPSCNFGKHGKGLSTVGDAVFYLLTLLFRHSTNYYQILELLQNYLNQSETVTLSDSLLLFIKSSLNCEHAIARFIELDGIRCIADNLVESYGSSPDNATSMITSILTRISDVRPIPGGHPLTALHPLRATTSTGASIINLAPLGIISSTCAVPSAGPSGALLQASQTHRRARTAPWSYKFTPEQPYVDIIVELPVAALIKEVQIHPYLSSLSHSGPSMVGVELSHNGLPTLPSRQPIITSGLTTIKVEFVKPEVASTVSIVVYKPRDSYSLGLFQICILGYPGLSGPGSSSQHTNHSLGWLELLYHCVDHVPSESSQVLEAVSSQHDLLHTCTSLLLSHISQAYHSQLEKVVTALAQKSPTASRELIGRLLRQNHRGVLIGHQRSVANEATADILFRLGTHGDLQQTVPRLQQYLEWLQACASYMCNPSSAPVDAGVARPSYVHVQCVAATLWRHGNATDSDTTAAVRMLLNQQHFDALYAWSVLPSNSRLMKRAVDNVLAALCHLEPTFFHALLQKFFRSELAMATETAILRASVTDDDKDDVQQELLTDERKEDMQFENAVLLDEVHLSLLATTVQSDSCADALIDSTLLKVLSQALTEFCLKLLQQRIDESGASHSATHSGNAVCITWQSLPTVLSFFAQCASNLPKLKDWLGASEGQLFWTPLLELLCTTNMVSPDDHEIESSVVRFFKTITLNHTANQVVFSEVMCNLLRVIGATPHSVGGSTLTSFTKNLLLQLLLEDEKIAITICARGVNYTFGPSVPGSAMHLRSGVGHMFKTVNMSIYSTLGDLANQLARDGKKRKPAFTTPPPPPKKRDYTLSEEELMQFENESSFSGSTASYAKAKREKMAAEVKAEEMRRAAAKASSRPIRFIHENIPESILNSSMTFAELMLVLMERGEPAGTEHIMLNLYSRKVYPQHSQTAAACRGDADYSSTLKVFTSNGGLALLAEHLPLLYPEITQPKTTASDQSADLSEQDYEFVTQVKGISLGEAQFEMGPASKDMTKKTATGPTSIPPHSLVAFGLFLRLPGYAEMLIKQRLKAKCLLRLVLGVRDDGEGIPILASPVAASLPTLPFTNLQLLYSSCPLTTDDGMLLRHKSVEIGALHLVLACLSALSHQKPRKPTADNGHMELTSAAILMANQVIASKQPIARKSNAIPRREETTGQAYWAKGTGFGTGSTTTQWDLEQSLLKQQGEEEHVTCMLDILSAMIDSEDIGAICQSRAALPSGLHDRLSESCLLPAIVSYLRNDSVLDMSRHVPLYKSVLRMLRSLASTEELIPLLKEPLGQSESFTAQSLLENMAKCVATYKSKLKPATKTTKTPEAKTEEEDQANSLNELAQVLSHTNNLVIEALQQVKAKTRSPPKLSPMKNKPSNPTDMYEGLLKPLQFDTFVFMDTSVIPHKFTCPHHYETSVRQSSHASSNSARMRRLAQEAVTLSTSLPLSASSSVFARCDEDRMDVMKVLITGPADTPYMNGCFEFDVFFPADYPNSPPLINLQTTGNHKVRFNPNLYNDGKVCLSVLNTWHGRPEEKWNAQTSSFLQVLVSIQSLILVSEPYFNEPGYERSRGTPSSTANCREYDSNIRQATVKYAMLETLKNPPPCFKEIIHKHFWLKRKEIQDQIELWLADQEIPDDFQGGAKSKTFQTISHNTMLLKKHYQQLMSEFQRMKPPEGCEDDTIDLSIPLAHSKPVPETFTNEPSTSGASASTVVPHTLPELLSSDQALSNSDHPMSKLMMDDDIEWPGANNISSHSSDMLEHEDMMDDDSLVGLMHDYDMGSPGGPGGMFL